MRGVLARENFLFCAIVFFLVQSLIGIFLGKVPSFLFAIRLIKNDLAFFYYGGCILNVTFTVQVYSYELQYLKT